MRHAGSLVLACRIQFPDQGWNLGPLHWERGVPATGPPGKSLRPFLTGPFPNTSAIVLLARFGLPVAPEDDPSPEQRFKALVHLSFLAEAALLFSLPGPNVAPVMCQVPSCCSPGHASVDPSRLLSLRTCLPTGFSTSLGIQAPLFQSLHLYLLQWSFLASKVEIAPGEFPGGPVVRTPSFHC